MKIGYPCINRTIGCKSDRTFRLKSYSEEYLREIIENNLDCLQKIVTFNADHQIFFFRITSDLVPFASHPVCRFDWQNFFQNKFKKIGEMMKAYDMRISMHPDQFTLINALNRQIVENSLRELSYHLQVLDLLGVDSSAKIQIHVGGVYGQKQKSMQRFIMRYSELNEGLKKRLVIENDDKNYTLEDCLFLSAKTGVPILFDIFHHEINSSGESISEAFHLLKQTWKKEDGIPMVDYSSQQKEERRGKHAESIDEDKFTRFLQETQPFNFDIMLEIKDKEKSALKAIKIASHDPRFYHFGNKRKTGEIPQ